MPQRSARQVGFDVLGGIVLPVVCLEMDPGIFRGSPSAVPVRCFVYLQMLALAWRLVRRSRSYLLAGWLGTGAVFAGGVGLLLLPLSLLLLVHGIGFLGLIPLLTCAVFTRIARWAVPHAGSPSGRRAWAAAAAGMALAVAVPVGMKGLGDRAVRALVRNGEAGRDVSARVRWMRPLSFALDLEPLRAAGEAETDPARKRALREAFHRLGGQDVTYVAD